MLNLLTSDGVLVSFCDFYETFILSKLRTCKLCSK